VFGCFSNDSYKNLRQQLDKSGFCLVDVQDRAYIKRIYGTKLSRRMFKFSADKSIVDEIVSFVGW